jgi:hypothetical protein
MNILIALIIAVSLLFIQIGSEHFLPRRKMKGSIEFGKIACGASCGSEDSRDIGRLILRTAGRCKVRSSKGIVSTRKRWSE